MFKPKQAKLISKPIAFIPIVYPGASVNPSGPGERPFLIQGDAISGDTRIKVLEAMDSTKHAEELIEFYAGQLKLSGLAYVRPIYFDELIELLCVIDVALPIGLALQVKMLLLQCKIFPKIICYQKKAWDEIPAGLDKFQIMRIFPSYRANILEAMEESREIRSGAVS